MSNPLPLRLPPDVAVSVQSQFYSGMLLLPPDITDETSIFYKQIKPFDKKNYFRRFSLLFLFAFEPKMSPTKYEMIIVSTDGPVGIIRLNRPDALNALCRQLTTEVLQALKAFDTDRQIGAIVITGSDRAFAAGADIKEMYQKKLSDILNEDVLNWASEISSIRKPIIAAVNGYAFGGGCELAMMCDIIYAGEKAVFGQPEINLGVIPGAGGTQRLVKAVGKSKAMEICLTGNVNLRAQEAYAAGLVSGVYPVDKVFSHAVSVAKKISQQSQPAIAMIKSAINECKSPLHILTIEHY
ncbi:hypothetical protein BB560_006761 [Smittium megazygosporum]|uniref:Enoyl-CoA hydratase n=1 Tax=Smittium megazygosporum TaxID=133381 RepID=A0A2T9Y1X1_9FUNG|nr:hypothetical protein BB560_006761 [Smittium megazygosporum]